ncbi:non-specific lipid transfer protein GPI-anchored 2-like [Momordica charantia]|uniref:Non-specific lipid transfer protein GPI-anchored 2-like n=1 Tax=Momordica charantia TaxID=3673 RepID=A0A6J1CY97_MOMCH|nr:non-specific lipid transfer protein GPI-anchored 2-like [Momordica charantia]
MASFSTTSKALIVAAGLLILVASEGFIHRAGAAGECGKMTVGLAAVSLTPCLGAVKDVRAKVTAACCSKVAGMFNTTPKCLCAILLSPMAKQAGINPAVAITIPKRCNIKNRPAGKKCGKYTLP